MQLSVVYKVTVASKWLQQMNGTCNRLTVVSNT